MYSTEYQLLLALMLCEQTDPNSQQPDLGKEMEDSGCNCIPEKAVQSLFIILLSSIGDKSCL